MKVPSPGLVAAGRAGRHCKIADAKPYFQALGVANHPRHAFREPLPALFFLYQLLLALGSQRVEACLPILLGLAPFAPDPALLFHAVKGWVKGSLLATQQLLRNAVNERGGRVPVHAPAGF